VLTCPVAQGSSEVQFLGSRPPPLSEGANIGGTALHCAAENIGMARPRCEGMRGEHPHHSRHPEVVMARGGTRPNAGRKATKSNAKKPRAGQQRLKKTSATYTLEIPKDLIQLAEGICPGTLALEDFLREMLHNGLMRRKARLEDDRRQTDQGVSHLVRNAATMERAYGSSR
jgi:hypothetical protein